MNRQRTSPIEISHIAAALAVLLIGGCQAGEPLTSAAPTQVPHVSPAQPYPLVMLTPTSTSTPEATWTPLPTLSSAEAVSRITELLSNNAGCELPCWWGVVPGQTSWNSARHFLAPFVSRIGQGESRSYSKDGREYLAQSFGVQFEIAGRSDLGLINFGVVNGVIDVIWVLPRGTEIRYEISQFLEKFNGFEEAWVAIDPDFNLFQLMMYFPDQGITALYEGPVTKDDSSYELCFEGIGPELWLWAPDKVFVQTEDQFIGPDFGLGPNGHEKYMRPIEAVGLDIEAFSETFRSPDPSCIVTPRSHWEAP
jgi:hypothetical protein